MSESSQVVGHLPPVAAPVEAGREIAFNGHIITGET